MIEAPILEQCIYCKLFFDKNKVDRIDIYHSPVNFYTCDDCLKINPLVKIHPQLHIESSH